VGGGTDAGSDGGATDAGSSDGGATDAGNRDSGAPDSGMADSGMGNDACVPQTCSTAGAQCGVLSDLCGGVLDCGSCIGSDVCMQNQCVASTVDAGPRDAGNTPPDAGHRDAGHDAGSLGDASGDAGSGDTGDNGGCGCRTVEGNGSAPGGLLAFGVVALGAGVRLRRRPRGGRQA
jgi:MYXO-CTERM domain-containing protein